MLFLVAGSVCLVVGGGDGGGGGSDSGAHLGGAQTTWAADVHSVGESGVGR